MITTSIIALVILLGVLVIFGIDKAVNTDYTIDLDNEDIGE